ncbi:fimbria/pilus periplasmic chaperone (plasmid) [Klebsiella michiganensis]|uniref:fimbrial biogenesis chaperone n=1 Tax=Klebsiella michiganensis TaxID=1134687 RepID=UPI00265A504A|nr:fimbria/pilus periplasmic chaperone [Klebsiella michiganensis]WKJ95770.1 fimbria/pilus periplasmic chaperone [Klebsiella michiganensis]WKK00966.1 fimbria/pilus periplasmic chaperone [Klebsiella michiganensis]WKK02884.1 fimbria/pilus periplasmic chaperone [Klebsiella michiganensis]WKK06995.1 fimbria/pilus periplasmic chaperone [Klebsiella michiganensis]
MLLKFLVYLMMLTITTASYAGVVINKTRVIYHENEGETVIQLLNKGISPVLTQSWIDYGDTTTKIESLKIPFILTPTVARIDPNKGQAIRIMGINSNFPKNHESLLWLNVQEIPITPAKKIAAGDNLLQFSFRTRLKFFFRPTGLASTPEDALQQLSFEITSGNNGNPKVVVNNPSPYYITFRTISLRQNKDQASIAELDRSTERMVSPMSKLVLGLKALGHNTTSQSDLKVFFTAINDQGGDSRELSGRIVAKG